MPTHQKHDACLATSKSSAKETGRCWSRRPRNVVILLVLTVVAVIVGALVVINRYSGQSGSGSATAKVGTGPNTTLASYFAANDINQVPVRMGEPGTPTVTIPAPPGWSDAGADIRPGAYAELLYDDAASSDDVPFVEVLLSRLDGSADPAKVLEYAPGELRNLPDYRPVSEPAVSQFSGFDAVQLGGLYTKNGEERLIAQKTVAIPTPNGLFVLQMNADAPKPDAPALQLATAFIDQQAKIEP